MFLSRRAGCVAMSCLPIGSPRLSSRRSGRFIISFAPSCDTVGGASGDCCVLSVLRSDFLPPALFPCACLPRGRCSRPRSSLRPDVDGGGRFAVCRLDVGFACLLISLYPCCAASCRSVFPFHGSSARSIDAALCRCPMLWV